MSEWKTALDDFSKCGKSLKDVIEQVSDDDLDCSLNENSWSIRQIIHHLADAALIWSMFYRQALGDSDGEFPLEWYWSKTQDEWAKIWNYSSRDIQSSLELYKTCNQSMIELLGSAADPRENHLLLTFPGEETQAMTVESAVRWQSDHLQQHLDEINKILVGQIGG